PGIRRGRNGGGQQARSGSGEKSPSIHARVLASAFHPVLPGNWKHGSGFRCNPRHYTRFAAEGMAFPCGLPCILPCILIVRGASGEDLEHPEQESSAAE